MRLVVKGGPKQSDAVMARWTVEVAESTPLMIGRDEQCDLTLDDDTNVSRHHVVCHAEAGGRLHIRDLGSRNGTYLNGAKVVDAVMLAGDEITIGGYRIRLETGTEPTAALHVEPHHEPAVPPTLVGATFTTSGAERGVAATAGSGPLPSVAAEPGAGQLRRREFGPVAALLTTVVLVVLAGAVVPLVQAWQSEGAGEVVSADGRAADAWRLATTGKAAQAARLVALGDDPTVVAVRGWIAVGGGLPVDRPGAAAEIPALERLVALPVTALDPSVRSAARARLDHLRAEQRAAAVARRALDHEAAGDAEAAIAAFEELGAWPETGAAKRHLGRAITLRYRRCETFRDLGASNRSAGDWDGALRCFRTAARHARGAQIDLVVPELREAKREVAALSALSAARTLAGAGEWRTAIAALDRAPDGTSQARKLAAARNELNRRVALRDGWDAYAAGNSGQARAIVDRWRIAGDAEATALWRRAGTAADAFARAEQALQARQWERARAGWNELLQIEPDDRVAWRTRALDRLAEWPVARVVAELRGAALTAFEANDAASDFAGRALLDRAALLDRPAIAAELDQLRTRAQLLYNTALNQERTDPSGALVRYRRVAAMTRPGEPKHTSANAAVARLTK